MVGRVSGIFLLCLLKHAVSVPMSELFEETGTFVTIGPGEESECTSDFERFLVCGSDITQICVSF